MALLMTNPKQIWIPMGYKVHHSGIKKYTTVGKGIHEMFLHNAEVSNTYMYLHMFLSLKKL